jgi:glycerophosphoryl diester phosphodiesterase
MTLAIALRGDTHRYRENTIPALRSAFAAGADVVAVDLRTTADGHTVLLQDDTLERPWGPPLPVASLTLAELAASGPEVEQRVPTLMEALAETAVRPSAALMLNVPTADTALAADTQVRELGAVDRVLFTGAADALATLRAHSPNAAIALTWDRPSLPPGDLWQALRPRYYSTDHRLLTRELVAEVQRHGYAVAAWTVNDFPEMVRMVGMGVDAIITENTADLVSLTGDPRRLHAARDASDDRGTARDLRRSGYGG